MKIKRTFVLRYAPSPHSVTILPRCCVCLAAVLLAVFMTGCGKKSGTHIAVFVPGIMADSPIYADMASGVTQAVNEFNASLPSEKDEKHCSLTISEAGTNQAQWGPLITALAATGDYNLIVSSNPSLPSLVLPLTKQFPSVKFILLDADMTDCSTAATAHFDQHSQSYLAGYAAALSSKSGKLGLVAAQEYPVMNDVILPGFMEGARAARGNALAQFRVVGNWYDATRAQQIAASLCDTGVDAILPIAGGANMGVISAARERGIRLVLFDAAAFDSAPDLIVACATVDQKRIAREMTASFLDGSIEWGTSRTLTAADGYVSLVLSPNKDLVTDEMRSEIDSLSGGYGFEETRDTPALKGGHSTTGAISQ